MMIGEKKIACKTILGFQTCTNKFVARHRQYHIAWAEMEEKVLKPRSMEKTTERFLERFLKKYNWEL